MEAKDSSEINFYFFSKEDYILALEGFGEELRFIYPCEHLV